MRSSAKKKIQGKKNHKVETVGGGGGKRRKIISFSFFEQSRHKSTKGEKGDRLRSVAWLVVGACDLSFAEQTRHLHTSASNNK